MKLTINEILLSTRALSQLSNATIPIGVAVKLAENLRTLNVVNEQFQQRHDLVAEKFGTRTKDGVSWSIPNEKVAEYNKEIKKITDTEIDIELDQCTISDLGNDLKCSPNDLVHLKWLFSDYNDKPKGKKDAASDAA